VLRQGWRGDDHAEPPDKLNALNGEMYAGILAALDQTDSDDSVRAVIVTGAARAFCAGADLTGGSQDVRLRRGQLRSGGAPGPGRDGCSARRKRWPAAWSGPSARPARCCRWPPGWRGRSPRTLRRRRRRGRRRVPGEAPGELDARPEHGPAGLVPVATRAAIRRVAARAPAAQHMSASPIQSTH
jgi:hypothetical protein